MSEAERQRSGDEGRRQAEEIVKVTPPIPGAPAMYRDRMRRGVAKITAIIGSGVYTITEQLWDSGAGPAAWADGKTPSRHVAVAARDFRNRTIGEVDDVVWFWEQCRQDGALEVLLDIENAPSVAWGKAMAAWASGNTVTLDPCTFGGDDNSLANVTGYLISPTGDTPAANGLVYDIAENDVLAYIPFGANKGVIVNAHLRLPAGTKGDLLWSNGTKWTPLPVGDEGDVLVVADEFDALGWETPASCTGP